MVGRVHAPGDRRDHDRRRRFVVWLGLSALLHLPMTPVFGLVGLLGLLKPPDDDDVPSGPPIVAIPIDLLEEPAPEATQPPAPSEPAAPPMAVEAPPEPEAPKPLPPKPKPPEPAPPAEEPAKAPESGIADPVAMAGGVRRVVDANANVRLIIDAEKLREHRLGPRVGALLGRVYQWRDFLGPTGIDPVRDIDRILIAGPQLRRSEEVVAVIQHRLGRERMRAAIDMLVQRDPGGEWLKARVPVARASADRAERHFVLPSEQIVVVTPKSALADAERLGPRARIPTLPGTQLATAYVVTPWRAFRGLPVRVPESIRWARARVVPTEDGGAVVEIEAEDETPELARAHAAELERAVAAATRLDLGVLGLILGTRPQRFIQTIRFDARENRIHGELGVTQEQILSIFDMAEMFLVPPARRPPTPQSSATGASRAAPSPVPAGGSPGGGAPAARRPLVTPGQP